MKREGKLIQAEGNSICKVKKERLASKGLKYWRRRRSNTRPWLEPGPVRN